jgi:hypothetical protein
MGLDISVRTFGFRAGSYSGFDSFRNWLAGKVGYEDYPSLLEMTNESAGEWIDSKAGALFHHSDCDGFISAQDAKRLNRDLKSIKDQLAPIDPNLNEEEKAKEEWCRERLEDWITATREAINTGSQINFH